MIFSGTIIAHLGQKTIAVSGTVIAGVGSFIFPLVIQQSFPAACFLRGAIGMSHATLMPALQAMLIPWAPHHESSRFFFFQGSGCLVGSVGSFYMGGPFIRRFGWKNLFVMGGVSSITTGLLYSLLVHTTPEASRFVKKDELEYIKEHRLNFKSKSKTNIPYVKMLTSKPVWSVNIAFSTFAVVHTFFTNIMPKYLTDQLNVDLDLAGQMTSLPSFIEFFFALGATIVADFLLKKGYTIKTVRRGIMVIAQLIPGVLCLVLSQLNDFVMIMITSTILLSVSGIQPSGAFLNINELCPPYAAAGFAVANTLGNVSGTMLLQSLGPILETWGKTQKSWGIIFGVMGIFNIIGKVFFVKIISERKIV